MYHRKSHNIIVNQCGEQNRTEPNEMQMRLAEYYVRAFAETVMKSHLSDAEKNAAITAVRIEYQEFISSGRRECLEMVS